VQGVPGRVYALPSLQDAELVQVLGPEDARLPNGHAWDVAKKVAAPACQLPNDPCPYRQRAC
jgi:hypothetical protein